MEKTVLTLRPGEELELGWVGKGRTEGSRKKDGLRAQESPGWPGPSAWEKGTGPMSLFCPPPNP